jgi:S-adenosylmethionine/arginine decarboxylase-like enzyme
MARGRRTTRRRARTPFQVEHHHMLLRLETTECAWAKDRAEVKHLLETMLRDIHMKPLAAPETFYVKEPLYNEGLTAIVPIQTSHVAFHFWSRPEREILHADKSNCLLQFDLYTCGTLTRQQVGRILHHMTRFGPTHAEITILNRNYGLAIDRHMQWEARGDSWSRWVDRVSRPA